ncbi:MAG: efflux RND transporter periplasmic adaptor subunit [Defluviitaleaceae bacterium]|nr:efflux RND transporter periplasmic adaptor subunit [Defluviitaleaceae bacterium]
MKRYMTGLSKGVLLVSVFGALMLPLTACGGGEEVTAAVAIRASIPVSTIMPQVGDIVVLGEYIGTMQPNQQVAVIPRLPGEVQSVYFSVGDMVEAGEVLFRIDTTDILSNIAALEAQLRVQDATVRAAQTGVQLVEGSAMQSQLLAASGGVVQAEAGIRQAEQNVEQARIGIEQAQMGYDMAYQAFTDTTTLFEAGVVSRSVFDQAEAGYTNAAAGLERARSGYYMANVGLTQAQAGLAQAQAGLRILQEDAPDENRRRAQDGLSQAQAARNIILVNLETVNSRLDDAEVRAPIGGVVTMRNVDEFGFANPQAPAFIIAEQDSMTVTFRVPRGSAAHLQQGDSITLHDGREYLTGAITEIAAVVDHSGLLTIRASIPNPPATLLGGTTVRVFADAQRAEGVIILPLSAIHYERGVPHVYIADGASARRVQVTLGVFDADYAEVISGISTSDEIISTWNARLADGVEIEIVEG